MKPNILLVMCDQLRYDAVMNAEVKTPHIDKLRQRGVSFTQGYSQVPVCIPARHCLISGQNSFEIGLPDNQNRRKEIKYPLPQLLTSAGYATCAVGKMHFLPTREHFGFDRMFLSEEIPGHFWNDDFLPFLKENGYGHVEEPHGKRSELYYVPQKSVLPKEMHTTAWTAKKSAEFIKANVDRPFFLFSSFIKPHPPFDPCAPYDTMYNPAEVSKPIYGETDMHPIDRAIPLQNGYKVNGFENVSEADIAKMRAYYYGSISQMDEAFGSIYSCLEDAGLLESTAVIFTSDHGEMLGDHRAFGKRNYFEQATKIPYILSFPERFAQGALCDELVSLPDLYATMLSLAGVELPPLCRGKNLSPFCAEPSRNREREHIIGEFGSGISFKCMLRFSHYKYIYYADGGREVLFDLEKDPLELRPITESDRFGELRQILVRHYTELGYTEVIKKGKLITFEQSTPQPSSFLNQRPSWPKRVR